MVLLIGVAACGSDEKSSSTTTPTTTVAAATTAPATTGGSDTTTAGGGTDVDAFCTAEIAAEAAVTNDATTAGPAFEALQKAAPAEIADAVTEVIANADSGPGAPEFDEPYGQMIDYMKANCDYTDLSTTATEYKYSDVPTELDAGGTIITLDNKGKEFHELIVFKVNEGVTETAQQLLALSQEESAKKGSVEAVAFAPTGSTAHTVVDLEPGRYIALCALPIGATPELMSQMEGPESSLPPGAGPPHFTSGMFQEITVS